jgi:26S proteasome regulatory subunit N5
MLSSYHEAMSQTAPSEPSSMLNSPPSAPPSHDAITILADTVVIASTAKPAAAAPDAKDKEKKEPVTARDHLDVAADLMTDIQVETYSSMDKREKTDL